MTEVTNTTAKETARAKFLKAQRSQYLTNTRITTILAIASVCAASWLQLRHWSDPLGLTTAIIWTGGVISLLLIWIGMQLQVIHERMIMKEYE